jgi:uncharacterized membrane protein YedE/YeeE
MRTITAAFAAGLVFGAGLTFSGMIDPAKVLGFLDVFGRWDPTLAIVMAAALCVAVPGFAIARRRRAPLLAAQFAWPEKTVIDSQLLAGAALFGIGWGLVGLCPGPALANLASLSPKIFSFVAAMGIGAALRDGLRRSGAARPRPA